MDGEGARGRKKGPAAPLIPSPAVPAYYFACSVPACMPPAKVSGAPLLHGGTDCLTRPVTCLIVTPTGAHTV